jgi:hypothetical protein
MSNETKQTTVDKIVSLLNKKGFSPVLTEEEIKFFKEMEKDQINDAYFQGFEDNVWDADDDLFNIEYYRQTYGGGIK